VTDRLLAQVESSISDTILDMIPSAETIESLHSRARIAREVLRVLHERLDDPPSSLYSRQFGELASRRLASLGTR